MTEVQKQIADAIIKRFKTRNGIAESFNNIEASFPHKKFDFYDFERVLHILIENKLLVLLPGRNDLVYLSAAGWQYETYDKFQQAEINKELIEAKRQKRKDESDELDLKIKRWTYRLRYWPFAVSTSALIVATLSYFKPEKKQVDLQPMQQEIQSLQQRVSETDSLLQYYIQKKKDTL